jgi:WD40 repeat protein
VGLSWNGAEWPHSLVSLLLPSPVMAPTLSQALRIRLCGCGMPQVEAQLKVLNGHTSAVNSVAFSMDCIHIVSCSQDESVRVWDGLSRTELKMVASQVFSSDRTNTYAQSSRDVSLQVPIAGPLSLPWTRTQDQWIITLPDTNRLMWVPHGIHIPLSVFPYTELIISCHGSISINFQHCRIGYDWASCYVSA